MEQTVESLCELLARSRLLSASDVAMVRQRWQTGAGRLLNDVNSFARWLVSNGFATEYQAGRLLKGQADRYFLHGYKLVERLGAGRMAGVYKAVHQVGQEVAVKILPPSKVKDPDAFGRFQREARLALKLRHVNVVRTFQVGEDGGLHFLVMEYLDGETLEEVLKQRRRLPPPEAVFVISQALQGLQHLYDLGIVHRDLKPANLMLLPRGDAPAHADPFHTTVKILDVGLGRMLFDEEASGGDNAQLTAAGAILGDPDYMAPEQARDAHAADIRSDVYSLGCCLYHALTGQVPFPDNNLVRKMVKHARETPPPLKAFNPEIPDALQRVFDWMTAKDPARRCPTPERAVKGLEAFLAIQPPAPETAGPATNAYLQWLETQEQVWAARSAAASTPVPTATPVRTQASSVPVAMPAGANVERTAIDRARASAIMGKSRGGVGRRAVIFLLAGIAGVATVFLGLLLSKVFRSQAKGASEQP